MAAMPRPREPYLHRRPSRHGKVRWYWRPPGAERYIRIPGEYGSPQFLAALEAAKAGQAKPRRAPPHARPGTLAGLFAAWKVHKWPALSAGTRRVYARIFDDIAGRESRIGDRRVRTGDLPLSAFTRKAIVAARDARAATPTAANRFLSLMNDVFAWGVEAELVAENPCRDVKRLKVRTKGFHTWSEAELAQFFRHHPQGTKARLAADIMLSLGLRTCDVVAFGRQHVRDGEVTIRVEKTDVVYRGVISPYLEASIAAADVPGLLFIETEHGQPYTPKGFQNWFKRQCRAAGLPLCSAHGLRKAGAALLAEAGASEHQVMAYGAWEDPGTAAIYTRDARREVLAAEAARTLDTVLRRIGS